MDQNADQTPSSSLSKDYGSPGHGGPLTLADVLLWMPTKMRKYYCEIRYFQRTQPKHCNQQEGSRVALLLKRRSNLSANRKRKNGLPSSAEFLTRRYCGNTLENSMPQKPKFVSDINSAKQAITDAPVVSLFRKRHVDLWHALRMLGGYEASRLVDKCAARLEDLQFIDDRTWIMLNQILAILSLEEADDPRKPFMGFFAAIDPNDPIVEEICILTDQVRSAMDLVRELRQKGCKGRFSFAA